MIKIAITGKIGSGKSTALNFFKKLGFFTLSSDQIIKEIYNNHSTRKELLKNIGISDKDYKKDILKKIHDPNFNYILKRNLYPLMNRLRSKKNPSFISKKNIFFEVPLLFEEKLEKNYNIIIFIKSDYNVRRKRVLGKGMTDQYFRTMNNYQSSDGPKQNYSDITILNNGSVMDFYIKINHYKKKYERNYT